VQAVFLKNRDSDSGGRLKRETERRREKTSTAIVGGKDRGRGYYVV
jgi:hypothetical protein